MSSKWIFARSSSVWKFIFFNAFVENPDISPTCAQDQLFLERTILELFFRVAGHLRDNCGTSPGQLRDIFLPKNPFLHIFHVFNLFNHLFISVNCFFSFACLFIFDRVGGTSRELAGHRWWWFWFG